MTATSKEVLTALHEARDLIARGWVQGRLRSVTQYGTPRYCTVGALQWAIGIEATGRNYQAIRDSYAALWTQIRANYPEFDRDDVNLIPKWNDDPLRTHDEVLAVFDKAIAHAEETVDAR